MTPRLATVLLLCVFAPAGVSAEALKRSVFAAHDTLTMPPDASPPAQLLLDGVTWTPRGFDVTAESPSRVGGDAVVWFDSALLSGERDQDRVPLEWYAARDAGGAPLTAPALLVVHSLHPRMPIARTMARELSRSGRHVFVIHLPGYGLRSDDRRRPVGITAILNMRQAIGDIRRARDAIAALPTVDAEAGVDLAGVSLGGFAAATAASLDGAFNRLILLISGGDGYAALTQGLHDAAMVRRNLLVLGYDDDRLRVLLDAGEPLHVAHRLDPMRTWLFAARDDTVIPPRCSEALRDRVGMPAEQYVVTPGDHYSAILALPAVLLQIDRILAAGVGDATGAAP
jgi:dienelactone hydrolase